MHFSEGFLCLFIGLLKRDSGIYKSHVKNNFNPVQLCNYYYTRKTVRDCKEVILLYCLESFLKSLMIYIITARTGRFLLYSSPKDTENTAGWGTWREGGLQTSHSNLQANDLYGQKHSWVADCNVNLTFAVLKSHARDKKKKSRTTTDS